MPNNEKTPLRVLILEDRAEDAELMLYELSKTGFKVDLRRAEDEAGFQSRLNEDVDIILADYALPRYDALRALRCVQNANRDIPFIIVTGAISDEEAVACIQHGATDYVRKDRLSRLGPAVESALQQKRLRDEQRRVAEALRASEAKYHLLFNKIHDVIFVCELASPGKCGRFLEINESACRRLGYTREELFDLTLPDINIPERARVLALIVKQIMTEGTLAFDTELLAKNGRRIPVEMSAHLIEMNVKPAMLVIARDMSEIRKLEQKIYEIDEMEKRFFGQELHDSVGQYVTALAFKSKVLENRLKALDIVEAAEASALTKLVGKTCTHLRNLSQTLFPVDLEKKGLEVALRNLLAFVETQFKASCQFDYQLAAGPMNILTATHLFRIIQESVNNAVKHNKARNFKISLACHQARIILTIWDDGLPPPANSDQQTGIGRDIMDYRRKMLNASLMHQKSPQGGNEMILSFPENLIVIP